MLFVIRDVEPNRFFLMEGEDAASVKAAFLRLYPEAGGDGIANDIAVASLHLPPQGQYVELCPKLE